MREMIDGLLLFVGLGGLMYFGIHYAQVTIREATNHKEIKK